MIIRFPSLFRSSAQPDGIKSDNNYADFIPVACHYNPSILLTKNGELMQIIRVACNRHDVPQEITGTEDGYLRDFIRKALMQTPGASRYAFWVHTVRNRSELPVQQAFSNEYAVHIDQIWTQMHNWKYAYENEVFISIVSDGQSTGLLNKNDLKRGGSIAANRSYREAYLEQTAQKLQQITQNITHILNDHYKAEILAVQQTDNGQYISKPMEFIAKLVNLAAVPMPVEYEDVSQQAMKSDITFGFNAVEAKLSAQEKRFCAIASIKHVHELPLELLDTFMQLPMEIITSQYFSVVPEKKVQDNFKELFNILQMSQNKYIATASRLRDMRPGNANNPREFVEQVTSVMVITDEYRELEPALARLQAAISKLGLIAVREDIRLEEFFWSQIPGNFDFVRRQQLIPYSMVAGMARLNYFPLGEEKSIWGEPVAILPTALHTPYLFHFHVGDNGHTLLFDYNSFPDVIGRRFVHFLMAQSTRFAGRIIFFDQSSHAEALAHELGGSYIELAHNTTINPFMLENARRNRGFICAWLATLLHIADEDEVAKNAIRKAVDEIFNKDARSMEAFIAELMVIQPELAAKLRLQLHDTKLERYFKHHEESFSLNSDFTVFNVKAVMKNEDAKIAMFSYLMHQVISSLDGRPTMIVLNGVWELMDNGFFAARLESLLEMLKENNAMLFMLASNPDNVEASVITPVLLGAAQTKIYMPDDIAVDYRGASIGLTAQEEDMLENMERQKGEMLIKHGEEVIPSRFVMNDVSVLAVLTGDRHMVSALLAIEQ